MNITILELLEKISVEYVEENIMEEETSDKQICQCGRRWTKSDFHFARCLSCLEFIPANIVIEGWR